MIVTYFRALNQNSSEATKEKHDNQVNRCLSLDMNKVHPGNKSDVLPLIREKLIWDLRSSGILRSVESQFCTDRSVQLVGPIYKGQIFLTVVEASWPLKRGAIACPQGRYRTTTQRCVISQKSADLIYIAAEAWNHARCWYCHINTGADPRTKDIVSGSLLVSIRNQF
jgi:hypothetical protein